VALARQRFDLGGKQQGAILFAIVERLDANWVARQNEPGAIDDRKSVHAFEMVDRAQAIRTICERHGVDIKAAALQFCATHPVVAAVIPGPRTADEGWQNAALMRAPIPGALWSELRRAGLLPENAPTPPG
jgi:aryl-alcohol dehydrogenase-like predicted oxidoreductase